MIEITGLIKTGGPLTKRISLSPEGALISDGSACVMSKGRAKRLVLNNLTEFADLVRDLDSSEAIALGALRADLQDQVEVTTQDRLATLNGSAPLDLIARNATYISYKAGHAALALIDIDTKGMPDEVKKRIHEVGGYWHALVSVLPELATTGRIVRRSTTTGLSRTDTGETFDGSEGRHIYVLVEDGADVDRFLRTLHERCWLSGFGWHMVGAGGTLLDRSIVDRMVGMPERLVFEGPPVLIAPLTQDLALRKPQIHDGTPLNTKQTCPPLRIVETAQLKDVRSRSAHRFALERAKAREDFVAKHSDRLAQRSGITAPAARRIIERQCDGALLPDVALPWDDSEFDGCTVAAVLADPARFVGAPMADPLEGVVYGRTKAIVMQRPDGSPWIHSFAHGRVVYELRYDARAIMAAIATAPDDQIVSLFTRLAAVADLSGGEAETIRNEISRRSGLGKRTLDNQLKQEREERAKARAKEEADRRAAERQDLRPQIPAPPSDAPWLPQMQVINDVLGSSTALEPPMRDIEGAIAQVMVRRVPNMHALTRDGANEGETSETRLPPPEQPLLTRPDETQVAEIIEQHIDYIDPTGRSVHLGAPFVKHFHTRTDDALPIVAAIATLPIVLSDGTLLATRGLDRARGIVFRVPEALRNILPSVEACTDKAVVKAMKFLMDDFLADVAADYTGKCILIAAALTIIERTLLPERPAFFVTAGRRGGGKTTTLIMLLMAVTGVRPSAAAWSTNDEERRKALLAYLMEAPPAIVWDNIVRGTQIACPHIEKACTSAFYSDRRLGVSELISVAASPIHLFTGNNIGPKGDLSSRSLQVRLEIERADPENRPFKHPDPIGWTEANRGRILIALYTILLGNPALKPGTKAQPQTRFKMWWTLIGSAVEHASRLHQRHVTERVAAMVDDPPACPPVAVNFRDLFLVQEEDDEENAALSDALKALQAKWQQASFQAFDLARFLNEQSDYMLDAERERIATLRDFLYPDTAAHQVITSKGVGKRLKKHNGEPVKVGEQTFCLKMGIDTHTKVATFHVLVT